MIETKVELDNDPDPSRCSSWKPQKTAKTSDITKYNRPKK